MRSSKSTVKFTKNPITKKLGISLFDISTIKHIKKRIVTLLKVSIRRIHEKEKIIATVLLSVSVLALAACSNHQASKTKESSSQSAKTVYPLKIKNYKKWQQAATGDPTWPESTQTFTHAPKKVVANTRPAELLLHLGLEKSIAGVGATFGDKDTRKRI